VVHLGGDISLTGNLCRKGEVIPRPADLAAADLHSEYYLNRAAVELLRLDMGATPHNQD